MSLYQILSSMGMGIFTLKNNSTTFLIRFTWAQIKTATSFSVLAEAVNKNFYPYYKIKNNIQGFSTRTKKAGTASGFAALPIWRKNIFHCYPWENRQFIFFPFCNTSIFHYFISTALFNVSRKPTDTGTTL